VACQLSSCRASLITCTTRCMALPVTCACLITRSLPHPALPSHGWMSAEPSSEHGMHWEEHPAAMQHPCHTAR
jgi:hypothetical protein